ncbi:hypothetical protein EJB05_00752, partial [Eragrostis curvula]
MAAAPPHVASPPSGETAAGASAPPSRKELLSMVKKHSHLIGWTIVDAEDDASDAGMDDKFWREMLDLFFVRGAKSNRREEDDLVFFVNNMKLHGYGFNDNMEDPPPFFVRRWAPVLDKVISSNTVEVDWERSFYLNLIAHTSYTVTVAICGMLVLMSSFDSIDELRNRAEKSKRVSPIYKVAKTVYASPSRVNFHLDRRKAVETVPAYPNICFSVDDFDDTFDAVIPNTAIVWFSTHMMGQHFLKKVSSPESTLSVANKDHLRYKAIFICTHRTLFSGYVSYQNVREAYDAGRSKFGGLLSLGHDHTKPDRLYMRGPEGRGEVEVAVSGIADQSHEKLKKDPGDSFRVLVHRAASAASKLAKHAYESASANKRTDDELVPLKCCLMSVSLPWDYIAHDLLHKDPLLSY